MDKQSGRPMQDMNQEIHNLIGGRNFGSMEELQAVLSEFGRQKNTAPIKDVHGLSSAQIRSLGAGCRHVPHLNIREGVG